MKYQRISTQKLNKIFLCFSEGITTTAAARIVGINRNTVNPYYTRIRELIFEESLKEAGKEFGEFECDELYFGARQVHGKRGRGAEGKTSVFGLLKRGESVFVKVVKNCSRKSLMPIIQGLTLEGSVTYTDGRKVYDGLILNGYGHHRVFYSNNVFARGKCHVNGMRTRQQNVNEGV